ncbi:MAG: hypothetical protein ACJ77K_11945 [Bacteroidia bacterium]
MVIKEVSLITFTFIFLKLELYSKEFPDTIPRSKSVFSIEYSQSLFSVMRYSFPDYRNLNPANAGCTKCAEDKKHDYLSYTYFDKSDLTVRYTLSDHFSVELGFRHTHEEIPTGNYNYDYRGDTLIINSIGLLKNRYLGFPISFGIKIPNSLEKRCYTSFEGGLNFDFVYYEQQSNGSVYVGYLANPSSGSSYYQKVDGHSHEINPRSGRFSFNRLIPFLKLNLEWYSKSQKSSFILGSSVEFKSPLQQHNTAEFYKYYRITPVYLGLTRKF